MAQRIVTESRALRSAIAGSLICAAALSAPALADVKAGVDAWSAGSYEQAVAEWQEPAAQGDADALFNLAQAYRLGRGVPADIAKAREYYAKAAESGHVKASDNYGLLLFQQGEQEAAMPYIAAASERGDPRAQYVMGLAHFNGDYAPRDWVRAYALLTLAQSSGLPQAANGLSQMDQYIALEDRQKAQSLARLIEQEANTQRTAQLAAIDLAATAPARPAAAVPVSAPVAAAPRQAVVAPPAAAAAPRPVQAERKTGEWRVQLGAFGVKGNADRLWEKLSGHSALAGTTKTLVPAGRVTKLQAAGFGSRAEAQSACAALKKQGQPCLVTKS